MTEHYISNDDSFTDAMRRNEKEAEAEAEAAALSLSTTSSTSIAVASTAAAAHNGAHRCRDRRDQLAGPNRLLDVVDRLGRDVSKGGCPWTRSVSPSQMLDWLSSEVEELRSEVACFGKIEGAPADRIGADSSMVDEGGEEDGCGANHRRGGQRTTPTRNGTRAALVSELGDILFDALMLEMMCRRDFGLGRHEAWDAASSKVERRTPYMKEWGDGTSRATTAEEAEELWREAKRKEKKKIERNGNDERPRTGEGTRWVIWIPASRCTLNRFWNYLQDVQFGLGTVAVSSLFGLALGALLSHRCTRSR